MAAMIVPDWLTADLLKSSLGFQQWTNKHLAWLKAQSILFQVSLFVEEAVNIFIKKESKYYKQFLSASSLYELGKSIV